MAKCISYVSQFLTLLPGDIVTTGTPPGGTGMKPPRFLNVSDTVTLRIEGSASRARRSSRREPPPASSLRGSERSNPAFLLQQS
jgi:2-keto-4-pentenoate hydratase/2-oxohepta-3-ene-1,7-dioic acid hydratase in catechol pathway